MPGVTDRLRASGVVENQEAFADRFPRAEGVGLFREVS